MKKSLGVLLFSAALIISCNSQNVNNQLTENKQSSNSGTVTDNATLVAENGIKGTFSDKPIHLTKTDFLEKVMDYEKNPSTWVYKGELPCIIDFYADWCAPCRITSPILEELAKEYSGKINVYKIDVQAEQELAAVFGIQGIPAFLYCPKDGNPSMTSGIAKTPEETKSMFKQNIEGFLLKKESTNL
jgi:thioredoxin